MRLRPSAPRAAVLMILTLSACDGGASGGDTDDTDAPDGRPELCDDAPSVGWDNFGAGFVTEACQPCHASTTLDRHDAPETVVFDTEEDVRLWEAQMLNVATGDAPSMPPQGGVSDDDRYLLEVWLTCGG